MQGRSAQATRKKLKHKATSVIHRLGRQDDVAAQETASTPRFRHQDEVQLLLAALHFQLDILALHVAHQLANLGEISLEVAAIDGAKAEDGIAGTETLKW